MTRKNNSSAINEHVLEAKELVVVKLACMIGFGALDGIKNDFNKATELGLSKDDLTAVVSKAMCVKNNARDLVNKTAYRHVGKEVDASDCCPDEKVTRLKEIAAIASAIGTNSLFNYQKHVSIGGEAGLSEEEIDAITKEAFSVKTRLLKYFELSIGKTNEICNDNDRCDCNSSDNANSGGEKSSSGCC